MPVNAVAGVSMFSTYSPTALPIGKYLPKWHEPKWVFLSFWVGCLSLYPATQLRGRGEHAARKQA